MGKPNKRQWCQLAPDAVINELLLSVIDQIDEISELIATTRTAGPSLPLFIQNDSPLCVFGPGGDAVTEYTPAACMSFVEWVRGLIRRIRQ